MFILSSLTELVGSVPAEPSWTSKRSTHKKRLGGLGNEEQLFRGIVSVKETNRGLKMQATGEKTAHLFHLHKPAFSLKESEMCSEIL